LSLDEAYLEVTDNLKAISSATQIAEEIRARIRAETELSFGRRLLQQVHGMTPDIPFVVGMSDLCHCRARGEELEGLNLAKESNSSGVSKAVPQLTAAPESMRPPREAA
jgi:hypothetical protein